MKRYTVFSMVIILMFAACKSAVKPAMLYGKWKYIKVLHPDKDPPDSVRAEDLNYYKPYIQFDAPDKFLIMWGSKVLSHGTFTTANQNIEIKEDLPDGQTRAFAFWVTKLTDKEIVFQNITDDKSKVTAIKE